MVPDALGTVSFGPLSLYASLDNAAKNDAFAATVVHSVLQNESPAASLADERICMLQAENAMLRLRNDGLASAANRDRDECYGADWTVL